MQCLFIALFGWGKLSHHVEIPTGGKRGLNAPLDDPWEGGRDIELGIPPSGWDTSSASVTSCPFLQEEQPLPEGHPFLLHPFQDGSTAARREEEQGAGVWWICFHPCPRCGAEPRTPPGVLQLLAIKTLMSEALISRGKVAQGCWGRILCHQDPVLRTGIHPGKGEVSPLLPQKPPMCRRSPTCVGHSMSFIPFFSQPLRFVLVFPRASSGCLHFVGNTNVGSGVSAGWSPQDPAGAQQKQMSHPGTAWTLAEQDLASLQDHAWRPRPILSSPVQESPWCAGVTPADPPGRVGCTWNLCGREGESHR